jgi:hypothetical protein
MFYTAVEQDQFQQMLDRSIAIPPGGYLMRLEGRGGMQLIEFMFGAMWNRFGQSVDQTSLNFGHQGPQDTADFSWLQPYRDDTCQVSYCGEAWTEPNASFISYCPSVEIYGEFSDRRLPVHEDSRDRNAMPLRALSRGAFADSSAMGFQVIKA